MLVSVRVLLGDNLRVGLAPFGQGIRRLSRRHAIGIARRVDSSELGACAAEALASLRLRGPLDQGLLPPPIAAAPVPTAPAGSTTGPGTALLPRRGGVDAGGGIAVRGPDASKGRSPGAAGCSRHQQAFEQLAPYLWTCAAVRGSSGGRADVEQHYGIPRSLAPGPAACTPLSLTHALLAMPQAVAPRS
jgi:hypothetical protein